MKKTLHFHHFKNLSIYTQLQIEEALLRLDQGNHLIINEGTSDAIVLGISGKPETLVDFSWIAPRKIPVIRRFSGGGCVFVDKNTLFITFLFEKSTFSLPLFPEPLLQWTEKLYQKTWQIPHFALRENDYVIQDKKCGGNAQYIKKEKWLHHTCFLWDFLEENMKSLLFPPKVPTYRGSRSHLDFLTPLKHHTSCKKSLIEQLKQTMKTDFLVKEKGEKNLFPLLEKAHRKTVEFL